MKPLNRLQSLGITLPKFPNPVGSYLPAKQVGDLVFVSGQLPLESGELLFEGKVGKDLSLEEGCKAAALCFINAMSTLQNLNLNVNQVTDVIKITGYVQSTDDFYQQPKVINHASELCSQIFGEIGQHARAAIGVNSLPLNAAVEIEVIFRVENKK